MFYKTLISAQRILVAGLFLLGGVLAAGAAFSACFGACVTTPCLTAEQAFSERGKVLKCTRYRMRDTGDIVVHCFIETSDGKLVEKRLPERTCWQPGTLGAF